MTPDGPRNGPSEHRPALLWSLMCSRAGVPSAELPVVGSLTFAALLSLLVSTVVVWDDETHL